LQPDLILSSSTPTTAVPLQQTATIPIIFATVVDPVGSGFVASLPRQQTWHALGAGFLVHPNGMRMLFSLGLAAGVMDAGAVVRRWQFCDERGAMLSETDLEALWSDAGPCIGIERTKLQRALLPGIANVRCRLGTSVTFLEQDVRRVLVAFSDGTTGDYDLVVGADGIKSTDAP